MYFIHCQNNSLLKKLLLIACLVCACSVQAQVIENVEFKIGTLNDGAKRYFFSYDLIAPHNNIPCLVQVKFTSGARSFYLKLVSGDVGNLVMPGKGKQIVWDYEEELIHFSGTDNKFDLEASPNVSVSSKVNRSKKLSIKLDDIYLKDKNYTFILYRLEKEVAKLNDMPLSQNSFSLEIPLKTKIRNDYQLCVTDGEQFFFSNTFKVKAKVATFWKALPFILVPIAIIGQNYIEENKALPGVPEVPAN